MGQVATLLGCTGRRPFRQAKDRLLAVARAANVETEVLVRVGTVQGQPRYLVAAATLRDLLPQLISKRDALAENLREEFAELHTRIDDVEERFDGRCNDIESRDRQTRQRVLKLEMSPPQTAAGRQRTTQG